MTSKHYGKLSAALMVAMIVSLGAAPATQKAGKQRKIAEASQIDARTESDIVYSSPDGKPLHLDLYFPKTKAEKPAPLVVYIHGGGWKSGNKTGGGWIKDVTPELLSRGYIVGSVEYRLSPSAVWPAYIHDVKAAIRFLRASAGKYNIDPDHIGVWGGSAGGHLVALLGTTDANDKLEGNGGNPEQSSRVQAVVDMFGPADLTMWPNDPSKVVAAFGSIENYKPASPVTYVTKDDPPFLILQGDADRLVPAEQSKRLYEKLTAAGVEAKLVMVKNGQHGLSTPDIEPTQKEMIQMMVEFYDKHLKTAASEKSTKVSQ